MKNEKINLNFNLGSTLLVIFVVLKLTKVISWSWLWVLSPIWLGWSIFAVVLIIVMIIKAIKK